MHSNITTAFLAMVALGLIASPVAAAPKSHVKERGHLKLTATLAPPETAPSAATGTAEIEVDKPKFKSAETAELTISVTGLGTGNYSVDATLKDASIVHLGDLAIDASVPPGPTPEPPVVIALPAGFDVSAVAKLTVSDATPSIVLEGELAPTDVTWKYIANVQVTGPETVLAKNSKSKNVHGHAVVHSFITDNVETKRGFLWVAFGAPADTELTINVDGVAVGTVLSTKQGKVMFQSIAETVVIRDMKLVTLTDAANAVVMQAEF
jgi:hypothetical protein